MALVLANRVQESATANTTVSFTLTGAIAGFQSFAVIGDTNTTFYSATDGSGNWEVGLGTYSTTGPTLTRTTIYASSNSNLAVTFSGAVNVFVTYPSGRSVNLDASGNVSALGTVSSGTWQGSTVGVAYGGTGVTASSGANSVVLRDANSNITVNRVSQANTSTTAAGGTTALTAASSYINTLVGTGGQTYTLPDATTLTTGVAFLFNNMATGTLTVQNYATGSVGTFPSGGAGAVFLTDNSTTGGTWDIHAYLPEGVTFGTNAFNLGSSIISGGTWQGGTIQPAYGGTGLTTFVGANNALYSTGALTLTAGTLPVAAGGTGLTSGTSGGVLFYSATGTLASSGALAANSLVVGGGAGVSPSTTTTGTGVVTALGVNTGTAGAFVVNGGALGTPSSGTVTNLTGTASININGTVGATTANTGAFTSITSTSTSGILTRAAPNQDGVHIYGRAGGTSNWEVIITPTTLSADRTLTLPDNSGTFLTTGATVTVAQGGTGATTLTGYVFGNGTGAMTASASIPNSATTATSANTASAIVARDASGNFSAGTITATLSGTATQVSNSLTAGTHLSGGPFNGSAAVTLTTDATDANTASTIVSRDASGNFAASGATLGAVTVGVDTDQTISTTSGNLVLQTAAGVNTGTITIFSGSTGNITLEPSTTGDIHLNTDNVRIGDANATATLSTFGTGNLVLTTNEGSAVEGTLTFANGANGSATFAPNGTGNVATTFNNGGNLTNNRNYVAGAIRNATTQAAGDIWATNSTGPTNPFRGVSLDNSTDTTRGPGTVMRSYSGGAVAGSGTRGRVVFEKARGTAASPTAVQSGDFLGSVDSTGYTSTGWLNDNIAAVTPAFFGFVAAENWVSNTAIGTNFTLSLAPTSTTITSAANLINVLSLTPQASTYRGDTHAFTAGKSGTYGFLDMNGNRVNYTVPIKFPAFLATAVNNTLATTGASGTGSVATLTFGALASAPFTVGSQVIVAGVTPAGYNGTQTVTACTTGSVSFASTATGAQTVAGTVRVAGSVGWQIAITDSPTVGGRMAFWDTTNSRFSYISDNSAV
jgi:hypothetical protein